MTENLIDKIYKKLPDISTVISDIETLLWGSDALCPYCNARISSPVKKESRHHCNYCNISFGVTTGTFLHNTKVDLRKWLIAIVIITNSEQTVTARYLGSQIGVTKDTALLMINKVKEAVRTEDKTLKKLLGGPLVNSLKSTIYG